MSQNFIIPQNEQQAKDASKLVIKTLGLGLAKTLLYNIPQQDKDLPLSKSQMLVRTYFPYLPMAAHTNPPFRTEYSRCMYESRSRR